MLNSSVFMLLSLLQLLLHVTTAAVIIISWYLLQIRTDDTSVAINELTKVNGIGPAAAQKLVKEGIMNVDGKWMVLSGVAYEP